MTVQINKALMARFATDSSKEEDGVWVDFGMGIRVKVRRFKSKKSQDYRAKLDEPFQHEIRRGALSDEKANDLLLKQIAGGVIVDWVMPDGLEYSAENAYEVLKALPEFRDEVFAVSVERENFKIAMETDAAGNSSNT